MLPMYVEMFGLSWFFVNCYALFIAWFLSGIRHRACVLSPKDKCLC